MRKIEQKIKNESLRKRYARKLVIRKKLSGTAEMPRVSIVKSNKHILVQVIDDTVSKTLVTASTFGKDNVNKSNCNKESAKVLASTLAKSLKEKNISSVVFDRSGYRFTGIISTFVASLKESGLNI